VYNSIKHFTTSNKQYIIIYNYHYIMGNRRNITVFACFLYNEAWKSIAQLLFDYITIQYYLTSYSGITKYKLQNMDVANDKG